MTKYTVKPTMQFKKDYKLAIKRGLKIELLEEVINSLANGVPLPEKNKDHAVQAHTAICLENRKMPYEETHMVFFCISISYLICLEL